MHGLIQICFNIEYLGSWLSIGSDIIDGLGYEYVSLLAIKNMPSLFTGIHDKLSDSDPSDHSTGIEVYILFGYLFSFF